jgi:thiamine pyrophosphate-dependent acetolactate synthase large subunit-like protein
MPGSVATGLAAAVAPAFVLERSEAVPALIGRHEDFLIIAGLGGTACDVGAVTGDAAHVYSLGGAMGAACMMGLGLALARPDRRVLVVTGDGELLMNLGALATIAVMNPPNLSILCVDNGHYGETGWQQSHTSLGVDLEKIAAGAGIKRTATVAVADDLAAGARLLREGNGSAFVSVRVKPNEPPPFRRNFDASFLRDRFRNTLLGDRGAGAAP